MQYKYIFSNNKPVFCCFWQVVIEQTRFLSVISNCTFRRKKKLFVIAGLPNIFTLIIFCTIRFYEYTSFFFVILWCVVTWIIERLDRKLMSQGLISYRHRRLVVSCSKMALNGFIIVKILWRNDGENVGQTSRKVGFVCLHVVLFRSFYCYFNFWCMFSLRLLSYGDGNPSKPHLNLRGKHFLFFCICRCLWENCVPKI